MARGEESLAYMLREVSAFVAVRAPHLADMLDVFAQEALFARRTLDAHLTSLPAGSSILEVGAGLLLLSCQLKSEGFDVCALEPIGHGFSAFKELQAVVQEYARGRGIEPRLVNLRVEELNLPGQFDFAFSLNVMEHVDDVGKAIENIGLALRPGARYVFICPNYAFPYEPHFNLPTFGSKRLTELLLHRQIMSSRRVPDPAGTWRSLNWITVRMVSRICGGRADLSCAFDRTLLAIMFSRAVDDPGFSARRGPAIRWLATVLAKSGLVNALRFIPASIQPVMMCTMTKLAQAGKGGTR